MRRGIGKFLLLFLCASLFLSVFTGCGLSPKEENHLTLYVDDSTKGYYSGLLGMYRYENPEVEVELVELTGLTPEEAATKVSADIMAGKGPDVFLVSPSFMENNDVTRLMAAGTFLDLQPLLDQDEDFPLELYDETILDAVKYRDSLYLFPISYNTPLLLAEEKDIENSGIELGKLKDFGGLVEEAETYLKQPVSEENPLFNAANSLNNFLYYLGLELIDYENKKVSLDTPEFRQACEFYQKLYRQESQPRKDVAEPDYYRAYQQDSRGIFESYCWQGTGKTSITLISSASLIAEYGQPVVVPLAGYDGKSHPEILLSCGIRRNTKSKEAAYKLVKHMVSINQLNRKDNLYFLNPIKESEKSFYGPYFENGKFTGELAVRNPQGESEILSENLYGSLSEEFFEDYSKTLAAHGEGFYRTPAMEKLYEYMEPYFKGEKSFEECRDTAQAQLSIYISE